MTNQNLEDRPQITVLGAGVSGLTTAIVLLEAGYKVTIITRELPQQTVSSVAAAIWFPYQAKPFEKVTQWSLASFHQFKKLADNPDSGISLIPFTLLVKEEVKPWWLPAIPDEFILDIQPKNQSQNEHHEYRLKVPLIETPIYLPYLMERFTNNGGHITQKEITHTDQLKEYSLIINCMGLGSKKIFNDDQLYPIQGQVVKVETDPAVSGLSTDFHFGEKNDELAYIIPRKDGIILGGSAKHNVDNETKDETLTDRIIQHCSAYNPKVNGLSVKEVKVGLRPGRTEIRLEKDPDLPIIHNYGHGGAGYTVSWGCAEEVLRYIEE